MAKKWPSAESWTNEHNKVMLHPSLRQYTNGPAKWPNWPRRHIGPREPATPPRFQPKRCIDGLIRLSVERENGSCMPVFGCSRCLLVILGGGRPARVARRGAPGSAKRKCPRLAPPAPPAPPKSSTCANGHPHPSALAPVHWNTWGLLAPEVFVSLTGEVQRSQGNAIHPMWIGGQAEPEVARLLAPKA